LAEKPAKTSQENNENKLQSRHSVSKLRALKQLCQFCDKTMGNWGLSKHTRWSKTENWYSNWTWL